MTRRASPTLIGLFVLGGLVLVVGALLVLGGREWFTRRVTCVMAFDGSVAGLAVGSPVSFRGVPVGAVSNIEFRYGSSLIVVFAQFAPSRIRGAPPLARTRQAIAEDVQKGLRAQLQLQSLVTGQLYVGLDYHPGTPGTLTGVEKDSCEIPTVPTALAQAQDHLMKIAQQLAEAPLKEVVETAARTLDGIERLVTSPELRRSLVSADRTLQEAGLLVRDVRARVGPAMGSLERTLDQAQRTIDEVGRDVRRLVAHLDVQVGLLATNVGATSDSTRALMEDARRTVRHLDEQIGPAMAALRRATDATSDAMRKVETTFGQVDGVLDGSSPLGYHLVEALEQLERAAASLRVLSEEIQHQPNVLLFGRRGEKTR
jgi:paraquat-inducible protein B